ncbi:unnamed protein product [Macrosiphum euphorbiae]|uniref:Uncharacterized protein n=1 Tax=Macrosiphum euphorbiae TaxID=13131 RepID=A0AAV0VRK7_9HEMI|nr:unnamed protein product [Macrosiphum euphorbiae]
MMKRSTPATSINFTLELIRICERVREILRGTGIDDYTASLLRSCPWNELECDPVVWAIYNRGWHDWTADVTHIYNAPIIGMEYGTERYVGELKELIQRRRVIVESQGGELNAMARIAVIAITFSVAKIRSDPILWAAYTRAWEDRTAVENFNRSL